MIEIVDHWLTGVRKVATPNFDARPANTLIDLLVIHNISLPPGEFGGGHMEQLFSNCLDCHRHPSFMDLEGLKVSSHLLIDREGSITQFVPFDQRAWHAGVSRYCNRENCNDFSIGIELEGTDDCPYTQQQYVTLALVTAQLLAAYPALSADSIVGHCDIAPERKTDPGPSFDWPLFHAQLARSVGPAT